MGGRDVIGFICLRDLFETLSSSKKAECFRVCFHCPSGVAIVSFKRLYRIRPYTPDDMANFSGAVLVGMILTPLDYVRLQLDHNASRACNHIALRHFIMTRSVQVLSWTKGASCSQFHSYRKSILGKLTKNFGCKSAAINSRSYPSFVIFLLFLSCFFFPFQVLWCAFGTHPGPARCVLAEVSLRRRVWHSWGRRAVGVNEEWPIA